MMFMLAIEEMTSGGTEELDFVSFKSFLVLLVLDNGSDNLEIRRLELNVKT